MPFDGLPSGWSEDLVRLRVALDGVRNGWKRGAIGRQTEAEHCALGWLLVATDWDTEAATRLALDYVYPALPSEYQHQRRSPMRAIYGFNDSRGRKRVEQLFADALKLAEAKVSVVR
jgi:hypothetical protein